MSTDEDGECRISDDQDEATTCQMCDGGGIVFGPTPGHAGAPWEYKCDECNGTGRMDPNDYEMEYEG